jgi:hypothetical protein
MINFGGPTGLTTTQTRAKRRLTPPAGAPAFRLVKCVLAAIGRRLLAGSVGLDRSDKAEVSGSSPLRPTPRAPSQQQSHACDAQLRPTCLPICLSTVHARGCVPSAPRNSRCQTRIRVVQKPTLRPSSCDQPVWTLDISQRRRTSARRRGATRVGAAILGCDDRSAYTAASGHGGFVHSESVATSNGAHLQM